MKEKLLIVWLATLVMAAIPVGAAAVEPPQYDATGTWDYELSAIWHNCATFTMPSTTGSYTTTQTGNSYVSTDGVNTVSGTVDGNRYLRWESEKSGSGMSTTTRAVFLQTPTYGKGYFAGSWSNATEACGWGGNITIVKRSAYDCEPSDTQLCLNKGRFAVSVTWRNQKDQTGVGHAVPKTDDSGLFWFFSESNLEMLIKILNGCGVNNRYWVFFAATTDQEFTVTVTDTETDEQVVYTNPLGNPANAVTDTSAIDTCP